MRVVVFAAVVLCLFRFFAFFFWQPHTKIQVYLEKDAKCLNMFTGNFDVFFFFIFYFLWKCGRVLASHDVVRITNTNFLIEYGKFVLFAVCLPFYKIATNWFVCLIFFPHIRLNAWRYFKWYYCTISERFICTINLILYKIKQRPQKLWGISNVTTKSNKKSLDCHQWKWHQIDIV